MAAGIIYLNGDNTIQPATLKEELQQKVHDRVSLKGSYTRIWMAQKRVVSMKFEALTPVQYSKLITICTGTANPITYYNIDSGYSFTGFPTVAEAEYYKGASLLKDMTITITEK